MTFCPQNPTKYCTEHTDKSRIAAVDDWILLFEAVMRQRPSDIPIKAVIDAQFVIRDVAKATSERLRTEGNRLTDEVTK